MELKPCPFCGSDFLYCRSHVGKIATIASIKCVDCDAIGPETVGDDLDTAKEIATQKWNTRHGK